MDQIKDYLVRQLTELYKRLDPNTPEDIHKSAASHVVLRETTAHPAAVNHSRRMALLANEDPFALSANLPFVHERGENLTIVGIDNRDNLDKQLIEALQAGYNCVSFTRDPTISEANHALSNGFNVLVRCGDRVKQG